MKLWRKRREVPVRELWERVGAEMRKRRRQEVVDALAEYRPEDDRFFLLVATLTAAVSVLVWAVVS